MFAWRSGYAFGSLGDDGAGSGGSGMGAYVVVVVVVVTTLCRICQTIHSNSNNENIRGRVDGGGELDERTMIGGHDGRTEGVMRACDVVGGGRRWISGRVKARPALRPRRCGLSISGLVSACRAPFSV